MSQPPLVDVMGQGDPVPDPSAPVPDRGYGQRWKDEWGSIPPYDSPVKGEGYYGMLKRFDSPSDKSSEVSVGVTINGKNYHVPSMVPGLTQAQIYQILSGTITPDIEKNAAEWAKKRIAAGLPVFATASEEGKYKPLPDGPTPLNQVVGQ